MDTKAKAVSLKYPENADAPYISAAGKGLAAQKMLEIAEEKHIPIVKDASLVNVISLKTVGEIIPEELYEAVAKVFAFVAALEKKSAE